MPKTPKPEPVIVAQECSVCGLDWALHGENPTAQTCIDLLKSRQGGSTVIIEKQVYPLRPWGQSGPWWWGGQQIYCQSDANTSLSSSSPYTQTINTTSSSLATGLTLLTNDEDPPDGVLARPA